MQCFFKKKKENFESLQKWEKIPKAKVEYCRNHSVFKKIYIKNPPPCLSADAKFFGQGLIQTLQCDCDLHRVLSVLFL